MEEIKEPRKATLRQNETLPHFICVYIHALLVVQPSAAGEICVHVV